jgi:hypothetical protein
MRTDPSRFDRVEQHPEYGSAPAQPVLPADAGASVAAAVGPLVLSLFGALFLLVALTILIAFRPPWFISVILVAGGLVFVAGGIAMTRGLVALRDAPVERIIAVVIKDRTDVSANNYSTGTSTSTTYYTTLQTRDGRRTEYRTAGALAGRLVVDDIGVAYVKSFVIDLGFTRLQVRSLVEFIRFDVD